MGRIVLIVFIILSFSSCNKVDEMNRGHDMGNPYIDSTSNIVNDIVADNWMWML